MNCRAVKLWLLQAETLKATAWPSDIAEHVVACAACAKVAQKIRKLENKWRDELPVVAETQTAKAAFLRKLRQPKEALEPVSVEEIDVLPMPAPEPALAGFTVESTVLDNGAITSPWP